MSASCRYCGNHIVFDEDILSKSGKKIPLNEWNLQPHNCPFSPFNKARATSMETNSRLEERQIVDILREHVAATSNRLQIYELDLIVREKEN